MWYPVTVPAPNTEPVTLAQARIACRVGASETEFDTELNSLIAAARAHVEARCAVRFAQRVGVTLTCDGFADLARLDEAPATVTAIQYVDTNGDTQTLSTDVYEARTSRLETAVVLKYGQSWPAVRSGSRLSVSATVGFQDCPEDARHAMMLLIADMFAHHSPAFAGDWSTVDSLLINHTRNA